MNAAFLDLLLNTFIVAFQQGFDHLIGYAIPLLWIVSGLAWGISLLPYLSDPVGHGIRILGHLVAILLTLGVYIITISNLEFIATTIFTAFAGWGAAIGGFDAGDFLRPSGIITMGFVTATPIRDYILSFAGTGWAAIKNAPTLMLYGLIFLIVLGSYFWIVKDVMVVTIEFHQALMTTAILLPFGVLSVTQELAGWGISWVLAVSVRAFLISALLGVGRPLFANLAPDLTPGGDPTLYSALVLAFAAGIFAYLVWFIPRGAERIMGKGLSLALPGAALVQPGIRGGARALVSAIRMRR